MAKIVAFRACLLASAAAGLTACASNPATPGPAPIDYRTMAPGARAMPPPTPAIVHRPAEPPANVAAAPPTLSYEPAPYQRVVDVGISPTGTNAVDEAKAMRAEAGQRPGGAMRQARDNPSARAIEVQSGDTLYDISRRYSVNMRALIETNDMEPPYALDRGDVVYLPPPNVHVVQSGETLYSVSRRYNVDTRSLALLNSLARPWSVWPGDELMLPPLARDTARAPQKPAQVAAPVVVASAPAAPPVVKAPPVKLPTPKPPAATPMEDKAIALTTATAPVKTEPKTKPAPPVASSSPPPAKVTPPPSSGSRDFIWPISGSVLKGFGSGNDGIRNDGVNIAAAKGADVLAAAGGEVVYAGSELAGFGNLILIRHPGGWVTAYAHSDAMKVKEGDLVKQGQPIATAGSTGNASATQVHFELRKGKEPVDPSLHLPPLRG